MKEPAPEALAVLGVAGGLIATLTVAQPTPGVITMVVLLSLVSGAAGVVLERERGSESSDDHVKHMLAAIREDQIRAKHEAGLIEIEVEAEDDINNGN